jgi:DNA-binding IclR family transcriptional regulator
MAKNQSLERGLAILNLLDNAGQSLGIREIARRLELSPTIVQRMVSTLAAGNFVAQDPDNLRYRLGYRAMSLGASLLQKDNLIASTMPELHRLANEHMLNGFLGVITNDNLVYVLAVQSSGPIAIRTAPGAIAHFHSTAMGKVLLADLPEEKARRFLERAPLPKLTDQTITDPERVIKELDQVRRLGYAISNAENLPGIIGIASRVCNESNETVAALSVAFAPNTAPQQTIPGVARLVVHAAAAISQRLGCSSEPRLAATGP